MEAVNILGAAQEGTQSTLCILQTDKFITSSVNNTVLMIYAQQRVWSLEPRTTWQAPLKPGHRHRQMGGANTIVRSPNFAAPGSLWLCPWFLFILLNCKEESQKRLPNHIYSCRILSLLLSPCRQMEPSLSSCSCLALRVQLSSR